MSLSFENRQLIKAAINTKKRANMRANDNGIKLTGKQSDYLNSKQHKHEQKKRREFFASMGLKETDPDDGWSPLQCTSCGVVSSRASRRVNRHEQDCPFYEVTLGQARKSGGRVTHA